MTTILVLGSSGFIGRNLLAALSTLKNYTIIPFDLSSPEGDLLKGIQSADCIVHLAGINRTLNNQAFHTGNVDFTKHILNAIDTTNKKIPLIVTSSIQATSDNPYGISKKEMEDILLAWSKRTNNPVYIYRLTNVFGKWCRPNYNSVVATFCHNLTHNLPLTVTDPDKSLTLVYVTDVVTTFMQLLNTLPHDSTGFYSIEPTYTLTLSELVTKLEYFNHQYLLHYVPTLLTDFDHKLYSTYLSYVEPSLLAYPLIKHEDPRGWLAECLKFQSSGQIFISITLPGITRGNHWHHTKTEKFLVLQGQAKISLRTLFSDIITTFEITNQLLQVVDIPPGTIHCIQNTGDEPLITLFWADQIFDTTDPDTFYEEVYV